MQIRNLQESDLPGVIKFVKSCEELTVERTPIFWLFWRFFHNTCFVALEGNEIVGILLGFLDQVEGEAGFIHELGVSKSHRQKDIASKLIETFERVIKKMGGRKLLLTTSHTNQTAIQFYEKIGFKNNGTILKVNEERIEFVKNWPLATNH